MTGVPFVSVIIPVWNAPDALATCLQALERQDYPKDRHEVIVVDNGSTDGTREVARRFPSVVLLDEPLAGSYRARNRGLERACGDYVAFTDADCVPDRSWLQAAAKAVSEHPEAGILAGRIDLSGRPIGMQSVSELYECLFAFDQQANVASGMCVTANWVSPRPLLLALGGFDPTLKSGGDADCARRMRAAGHPIVYVADMLVRHPARTGIGELIRKRRRIIGGRMKGDRSGRPPLSWLWTYTLITGAQAKRALRESQYSWSIRARLCLLIGLMGAASMLEVLRVAFGGEPRRA